MPDDYYVSQYSGEEIDALLGGAGTGTVRYDAAQTLADAQKQQARGNIAAAPDGFGLGSSATLLTSADNLDALMKSGWFQYDRNNPPQGTLPTALATYATLVRVSVAGNTCVQEAYDPTDSNLHGTVLRRTVYGLGAGAKIYPWEWVNPPMILGVEYRTTERYLGKPVYVRLVNFGALGNATTKSVDVAVENTDKIPVLGGTALEIPLIPGAYNGAISGISATRTSAKITISITTTADLSWMQAEVLLGYTKTTN